MELSFALKHLRQRHDKHASDYQSLQDLQSRLQQDLSAASAVELYKALEATLDDISGQTRLAEQCLRLCPGQDTSALAKGTLVAAVDTDHNEWILARIQSYDTLSRLYTVEREDGSADTLPCPVSADGILVLPESDEAALDQSELKPKQKVLALFPGTASFRAASIISTPGKRRKSRDYLVKFADEELPSRPCPARFVIPFPQEQQP